MLSARDAVAAGLLAGPLAMLPALLFFICMVAYYPAVQSEALPSDFLLERLELPWFRILFQLMIFTALLESGTGGRSEEHTSELQSLMRISYAVFCLKTKTHKQYLNQNIPTQIQQAQQTTTI